MVTDERSTIAALRAELALEQAARMQATADADHQRTLTVALQDVVRSRDGMLSVVAHDLRNPLNIISLAAGNLLTIV